MVIDNVKQYIPNEKHEIVQLSDITIEMCLGCRKCFEVGHCPLDDLDDMKIIKEKMLQSDIILFASPVYAHNLSGIMKNFLDRITYWIHLMRLHNKLGIVVVSTSQSGGQTVTNYLKMFLTWLGVNVILDLNYSAMNYSNDDLDKLCSDLNFQIKEKLSHIDFNFRSNKDLESHFQGLKNVFMSIDPKELKKNNNNEIRYWVDSGMINQNDFREWLDFQNMTSQPDLRKHT